MCEREYFFLIYTNIAYIHGAAIDAKSRQHNGNILNQSECMDICKAYLYSQLLGYGRAQQAGRWGGGGAVPCSKDIDKSGSKQTLFEFFDYFTVHSTYLDRLRTVMMGKLGLTPKRASSYYEVY